MRLLLDAHISPRRVAPVLRAAGHDVLAAAEDEVVQRCSDENLLACATAAGRILVTCNVRDFARIARTWTEGRRPHAGCIFFVGIDNSEFGLIVQRVQQAFEAQPDPPAWRDLILVFSRHG
jgi:predicted nuclease of predicted toxin-antitoxin system